jgi:hypothetical protein
VEEINFPCGEIERFRREFFVFPEKISARMRPARFLRCAVVVTTDRKGLAGGGSNFEQNLRT